MTRRRDRGDGKLGCVVSLALLAVAIIVAIKAVPVRISVAEMEDFCKDEAERASLRRERNGQTPEQQISAELLYKAQQENLPVAKDQIKVWADSDWEHVEVKYRVVIDFLVYKYNWDVVHRVDRRRF
ncbi:MAG: hypothetical protein ACHQQS_14890 [Thermoanaerobaculales bacterium]|jgi:hypothetical protein